VTDSWMCYGCFTAWVTCGVMLMSRFWCIGRPSVSAAIMSRPVLYSLDKKLSCKFNEELKRFSVFSLATVMRVL